MRGLLTRIEAWFDDCPGAAVAFSGGVDSSLVAYLARLHLGPERTGAYIAASPSLKLSDLDEARRFCGIHEIPLVILRTRELDDPRYAENPIDRCYYCKTSLYDEMFRQIPADDNVWMLNGTNADDPGDHRPGLTAATERNVRSPLLECRIDKSTVRQLAEHFGLACAAKPASPCMSSRIPYGQRVTLEKLKQIEAGEAFLTALGFSIVRLRHHGSLASIEVPTDRVEELRRRIETIEHQFCELGFAEVRIDDDGFVSGKLNRGITPDRTTTPRTDRRLPSRRASASSRR